MPLDVIGRLLGHADAGPAITRVYIAPDDPYAPSDLAYLAGFLAKLHYPAPAGPGEVIDLQAERARRAG